MNVSGTVSGDTYRLTFSNNKVTGDDGGAITFASTETLSVSNAKFAGNVGVAAAGAIDINSGAATFSGKLAFTNNTAKAGGGVQLGSASAGLVRLTIAADADVLFDSNIATDYRGGGLDFDTSSGGSSEMLTLESGAKLTFTNNKVMGTSGIGGAMYLEGTLVNNAASITFDNNSAANGGAVYANGAYSYDLSNSTFTKNVATANGGGIYAVSGSTITLSNTTFGGSSLSDGNSAVNGGAVYALGDLVLSGSNEFRYNQATTGNGAGVYAAGTLTVEAGSDTTFEGNQAMKGFGGGLYLTGELENNLTAAGLTFSANSAVNGAGAYISGTHDIVV